MDQNFENLQNAQRLRYEAFSRFATMVNRCTAYHQLSKILSSQLKFIINTFIFRLYYRNNDSEIAFQGFTGQHFFLQNTGHVICKFDEAALQKAIPISYLKSEISSGLLFADTIFTHTSVFSAVVIPVIYSDEQRIVITIATTEDKPLVNPDFKFIQLISDFLANKLAQLLLLDDVAKKSRELDIKNKQVTSLNQYLDATVKERTFELTEINAELKTLLYRTTHDFRAPLANIIGLANLGIAITNDQEIMSIFNYGIEVANKMDQMLSKLNSVLITDGVNTKLQLINFPEFTALLYEKFKQALEASNGLIKFSYNTTEPVRFYQNVLEIIFDNLINNSICFRNAGRTLEIDVSILYLSPYLTIIFADNGQGIDPLSLKKIFNMYYRGSSDSTGHGLGLYIVNKLIKSINGDIAVTSEINEYTKFTIQLPI